MCIGKLVIINVKSQHGTAILHCLKDLWCDAHVCGWEQERQHKKYIGRDVYDFCFRGPAANGAMNSSSLFLSV
jgi:hypothetical protein